jgi:hypothetical protein
VKKTDAIASILAEEAERFEREKDLPPKGPLGRPRMTDVERGQVYSIRIPVGKLEELRQLASSKGEQPTALMRKWILERLDREAKKGPVTKRRRSATRS